jgi:hypothetical protein
MHPHTRTPRPQLKWRLSDEPVGPSDKEEHTGEEFRKRTRCRTFLSYTSNLVSAGVREHIRRGLGYAGGERGGEWWCVCVGGGGGGALV